MLLRTEKKYRHAELCTVICTFYYKYVQREPVVRILDWSKLKAVADDKLLVVQKMEYVPEREEQIVGKEDNAGYQCRE